MIESNFLFSSKTSVEQISPKMWVLIVCKEKLGVPVKVLRWKYVDDSDEF